MQKFPLLLILPVLLLPMTVDSSPTDFQLSNQEVYQFQYHSYTTDFQTLPENPLLLKDTESFQDSDLQQPAKFLKKHSRLTIAQMLVNKQQEMVFQLENGTFVRADKKLIATNQMTQEQTVQQNYWTTKNSKVYDSPTTLEVAQFILPYKSVKVSKIVTTPIGQYAYVHQLGWINLTTLSSSDNRMEAVQELLKRKYSSENISIYVKQLSTEKTAGVHQNKKMYAASVSKLPTLYYTQKMLDEHKLTLDKKVTYSKANVQFKGSFAPEGSGSLPKSPNGRTYTIGKLIDKVSKESDNVASNLLAYSATNEFDHTFYQAITRLTGERWDMEKREASAQMAGQVMEAIYHQNGGIIDSLSHTNFDQQRIARDLPVPVAHKIGDAYDFRHDVAIVYADSPYVLSIFTDKSTYDTISKIANDVYEILK